jgi:hypothetical protein
MYLFIPRTSSNENHLRIEDYFWKIKDLPLGSMVQVKDKHFRRQERFKELLVTSNLKSFHKRFHRKSHEMRSSIIFFRAPLPPVLYFATKRIKNLLIPMFNTVYYNISLLISHKYINVYTVNKHM